MTNSFDDKRLREVISRFKSNSVKKKMNKLVDDASPSFFNEESAQMAMIAFSAIDRYIIPNGVEKNAKECCCLIEYIVALTADPASAVEYEGKDKSIINCLTGGIEMEVKENWFVKAVSALIRFIEENVKVLEAFKNDCDDDRKAEIETEQEGYRQVLDELKDIRDNTLPENQVAVFKYIKNMKELVEGDRNYILHGISLNNIDEYLQNVRSVKENYQKNTKGKVVSYFEDAFVYEKDEKFNNIAQVYEKKNQFLKIIKNIYSAIDRKYRPVRDNLERSQNELREVETELKGILKQLDNGEVTKSQIQSLLVELNSKRNRIKKIIDINSSKNEEAESWLGFLDDTLLPFQIFVETSSAFELYSMVGRAMNAVNVIYDYVSGNYSDASKINLTSVHSCKQQINRLQEELEQGLAANKQFFAAEEERHKKEMERLKGNGQTNNTKKQETVDDLLNELRGELFDSDEEPSPTEDYRPLGEDPLPGLDNDNLNPNTNSINDDLD